MNKVEINTEKATLFPDYLMFPHRLCFLNHDVLVELLRAGEESGIFSQQFKFKDEKERKLFEEASDVFAWLETTHRVSEKVKFLKRVVFPALLSDFLHFMYEALECSRLGKLSVAYSLLRKPIQESLFLFEVIASEPERFATHLAENPLRLRARHAGGLEVHSKRISCVLSKIGCHDYFDSDYLSQLRYAKVDDGFDGICNQATHLFTQHEAIRTESLNINFIFSGEDSRITQWYYLYSRMPYLLFYSRRLIEYVCSTFALTDPNYSSNIERRIMAGTILWAPTVPEQYRHKKIDNFINTITNRFDKECNEAGCISMNKDELMSVLETGVLSQPR